MAKKKMSTAEISKLIDDMIINHENEKLYYFLTNNKDTLKKLLPYGQLQHETNTPPYFSYGFSKGVRSFLSTAFQYQNVQAVKDLLELNIFQFPTGEVSWNYYIAAMQSEPEDIDPEKVKELFQIIYENKLSDLYTPGDDYQPLFFAIILQISTYITSLIELDSQTLNSYNHSGCYPLHTLVKTMEDPEMIDFFIQHGADVNSLNKIDDSSALEAAVRNRMTQNGLHLLKRGLNPNKTNIYGNSPLHHFCATYGNYVLQDDCELMRQILDQTIDINQRDNGGKTVLHIAASRHLNIDMIKMMLRAGADINMKDYENRTPAHYALLSGTGLFEEMLEEHMIDFLYRDEHGRNYLMLLMSDLVQKYRSKAGDLFVRLLGAALESGVNLDRTDSAGRTIFDYIPTPSRFAAPIRTTLKNVIKAKKEEEMEADSEISDIGF